MKKIVLALSVLGLVTLSSCGAQESCRGDRGYSTTQKIEKQHITLTADAVETDNRQ